MSHSVDRLLWKARSVLGKWTPYPANEYIPCNLCTSTDSDTIADRMQFGMHYRTVICNNCGLIFTNPRPALSDFDRFYKEMYPALYSTTPVSPNYVSPRGIGVANFISQHIALTDQSGVMDIGAQNFGLMNAFSRLLGGSPTRVSGCDPMLPESIAVSDEHRSMPLFNSRAEELPSDVLTSHSVFVLYDVLEHLLDPMQFLARLSQCVEPGAFLFISTNCIDNWKKIPREHDGLEGYYLRLAHTFSFSEATLRQMLNASGWQTVATDTTVDKGDQWVLSINTRATELRIDTNECRKAKVCLAHYQDMCANEPAKLSARIRRWLHWQ